jgi:HD-GYP domain-containing protein (c-di-GMP phosphodiesterase class II)
MRLSLLGVELVRQGAQYHDQGKDLQQKLFYDHRGKFTEAERVEAFNHAYLGAVQILKNPSFFGVSPKHAKAVALIILTHNWPYRGSLWKYEALVKREPEFFYGGGELPLVGGRIVMVADHYLARQEPRPYYDYPPLTSKETLDEMEVQIGTRFCPKTFQALLQVLRASRQTKES